MGYCQRMTTNDIQQAVSGFKTVDVIGGPCIVRIHEARDCALSHTPHRYFISVDFRFRQNDAMNIGNLGYYGVTKSEATRAAKSLAAEIYTAHKAMEAANDLALKWDDFTNRYTAKIQTERFNKIVAKYNAEFVQ
jgi:hypothetical protein